MRRSIVQTSLIFVVLTLLFYFVFLFFLNNFIVRDHRLAVYVIPAMQNTGGQERKMMQEYHPQINYDVIVLGSSHAYRGYSPEAFHARGINLFNSGTSSQNAVLTYFLCTEFLRPAGKPLIILDLYDRTFESTGLEGINRVILNSTNDKVSFDLALSTPDIRTFNVFFSRFMIPKDLIENHPKDYVSNGFCFTDPKKSNTLQIDASQCICSKKTLRYFQRLLEYLVNNDFSFICVSHPQPENGRYYDYHRSFIKQIQPMLSEYDVKYIDLTSDSRFETELHFADGTHLNQAGVLLFNELLIDSIYKLDLAHRNE